MAPRKERKTYRKCTNHPDRIIEAATRLFSEYGFEGATTRAIAAAAGFNIATVHHHVGVKGDLYRIVLQHLYEEETALVNGFLPAVEAAMNESPCALEGVLVKMVDAMVDMMHAHPARPMLYMRRWMEPQDGLSASHHAVSLKLSKTLRGIIVQAQRAGWARPEVDPWFLLRSLDWMIYGYFVAGPIDAKVWRGDPHHPNNLRAFKRYLHDYLRQMLGWTQMKNSALSKPLP